MALKTQFSMMNLLYRPIYSFFKGKEYDFSTLGEKEIFLSYPNTFNDKFEGLLEINFEEFAEQCLLLFVGEAFFNEIIEKFKLCKEWDLLDELHIHTCVNGLNIPANISDSLKNLLLKNDWKAFKQRVTNKYNAYCREINKVRNSFGIRCFTAVPPDKNSVMWAYYGNNHNGICGCFSLSQVVYDIPSTRCDNYGKAICEHFERIHYQENFAPTVKIDCKKLLDTPIKMVSQSEYIMSCVKKSLLVKQSQWKHENEIRLIVRDNDENFIIKDKSKKGFKIKFPYLTDVYFCSKKKDPFGHYHKYTFIYNKIRNLAEKLRVESIALIPSPERKEFIKLKYIFASPDSPSINYTEDDIPF